MSTIENRIKEKAKEFGFSFAAIASVSQPPWAESLDKWLEENHNADMGWMARNVDLRKDPSLLMDSAKSILIFGFNYFQNPEFLAHSEDVSKGRISLYAWGKDYHDLIRERLHSFASYIKEHYYPELKYRAFVDTAPLLERSIAYSANLGFIGKNSLLIRPGFGSWMFLSELMINLDLTPDPSPEKNKGCGKCTLCKSSCPTGALKEDYSVAAERCISYLTIENKGPIPLKYRKAMGNRIYGCDDCQLVCPYNKKHPEQTNEEFFRISDKDIASPPLIDLMELDEISFRSKFEGSAIKRIKRRGLLRNVAIALGNWGHPDALPVLMRAMNDSEALIRGHAVWAYSQIEKPETVKTVLQHKRITESDPFVLSEIDFVLQT